mmetsp:Transcript_12559/g.14628  ORF Transcript_12559/g.14628 Transcript_12559/m.14628 type:complete len:253 (+) Transcript_12559:42-800(+)
MCPRSILMKDRKQKSSVSNSFADAVGKEDENVNVPPGLEVPSSSSSLSSTKDEELETYKITNLFKNVFSKLVSTFQSEDHSELIKATKEVLPPSPIMMASRHNIHSENSFGGDNVSSRNASSQSLAEYHQNAKAAVVVGPMDSPGRIKSVSMDMSMSTSTDRTTKSLSFSKIDAKNNHKTRSRSSSNNNSTSNNSSDPRFKQLSKHLTTLLPEKTVSTNIYIPIRYRRRSNYTNGGDDDDNNDEATLFNTLR